MIHLDGTAYYEYREPDDHQSGGLTSTSPKGHKSGVDTANRHVHHGSQQTPRLRDTGYVEHCCRGTPKIDPMAGPRCHDWEQYFGVSSSIAQKGSDVLTTVCCNNSRNQSGPLICFSLILLRATLLRKEGKGPANISGSISNRTKRSYFNILIVPALDTCSSDIPTQPTLQTTPSTIFPSYQHFDVNSTRSQRVTLALQPLLPPNKYITTY